MPTKPELMAENAELRKRIKANEELVMQAAIKVKDLQAQIEAAAATTGRTKLKTPK